jgi:hypothetical protein
MKSVLALWIFLVAISAWGSAFLGKRDPRSTSWTKVAFAGLPLLAYAVVLVDVLWINPKTFGEGLIAHAILIFYWLMTAGGAAVCIGSIIGTLIGMFCRRGG